jgi:hypothetical protein
MKITVSSVYVKAYNIKYGTTESDIKAAFRSHGFLNLCDGELVADLAYHNDLRMRYDGDGLGIKLIQNVNDILLNHSMHELISLEDEFEFEASHFEPVVVHGIDTPSKVVLQVINPIKYKDRSILNGSYINRYLYLIVFSQEQWATFQEAWDHVVKSELPDIDELNENEEPFLRLLEASQMVGEHF